MPKGSSAKVELKERSAARAKKRDLKSLRKRKRKNGLDDDDSDDENDGFHDDRFMPTPAQMRAAETGANVMSSKKKKKKSKEERNAVGHSPSQSSISINRLPKVDFSNSLPFRRCFWNGAPGEDPLSDELKALRKSIGVNCKGLLKACPPPIEAMSDAGLPESFGEFFKKAALTTPSVVQKQCWPAALAGLNILGIAPTGSGKTLAYTLPMVPHIRSLLESPQLSAGRHWESGAASSSRPAPHGLVLVPTRELAIQVVAAMKPLQKLFEIRSVAIYGGQDRDTQIDQLSLSTQKSSGLIVVATPGRLLDLIATKILILSNVTYLVIDEADRMLSMGFFDQLTAIASQVRPDRQTLLFSATFPGKLREAAAVWCGEACTIRCNTLDFTRKEEADESVEKMEASVQVKQKAQLVESDGSDAKRRKTDHPTSQAIVNEAATAPGDDGMDEEVDVDDDSDGTIADGKQETTADETEQSADRQDHQKNSSTSSLTVSDAIAQHVHVCVPHKRPRLLIKYILRIREIEKQAKVRQVGAMLIFCTKIKTAGFVHGFLRSQDVQAEMLHGQLPQSQREQALTGFRAGKINCLVSTDVAARGIHVSNLKYVVNYDFPGNLEQYCHRIGRTGRQGGTGGQAYSFFTRNLAPMAPDLLALLRSCGQEPAIKDTNWKNLVALAETFSEGGFVLDEEALDEEE